PEPAPATEIRSVPAPAPELHPTPDPPVLVTKRMTPPHGPTGTPHSRRRRRSHWPGLSTRSGPASTPPLDTRAAERYMRLIFSLNSPVRRCSGGAGTRERASQGKGMIAVAMLGKA